jgi:riboflavin transporter FmnP
MTTIFYAIPSGFTFEQTIASIIGGIPFYLINMIANTITFSVLITLILKYVIKNYPHYLKGRS